MLKQGAADPTRRVTGSGAVVGLEGSYNSHVWYGIPYARPPIGDLRWRAPQPPPKWEGDFAATKPPAPSCQIVYGDPNGATVGSEDCLYLSVWAPRLRSEDLATAKMPVMFWIHGGGNRIGNGAEQCFGHLATSQNVIVVSVNFRLDFFGWFFHRALRTGSDAEGNSGNFGTLDQIQALKWVRENIARFGGDPSNVTIFGESAGGHNVLALLQSPRAAGLFHRAMPMSAENYYLPSCGHAENFVTDSVPGHPISSNEMLISLIELDGKAAADADAARTKIAGMSDSEIAGYLRQQTYTRMLAAIARCRQRNAGIGSAESQAGWMLYNNPLLCTDGAVIKADWHNEVPILIGCTRYEDRTFLADDPRHVVFENDRNRLKDKPWYLMLTHYLGQFSKANGVDDHAARFTRLGSSVYAYRFDWDDLVPPAGDEDYIALRGAEHGSEVPLFLGSTDLGQNFSMLRLNYDTGEGSSFLKMAATIMSYVGEFARSGNPGRGGQGNLPEWKRWEEGECMVLDSPKDGGVRMTTERLTRKSVLDALRLDPRLESYEGRVRLVEDLRAYFVSPLVEDDYQSLLASEKTAKLRA